MDHFISIIVPIRDEVDHIKGFLDSIGSQDFPKDRCEVFLMDGMSRDGTRNILHEFMEDKPRYRLIDNPEKVVPFALNRAIKESKGDVIIRLDCHCEYPNDYISRLVKALFELDADNVGGVWKTEPGDGSATARAIVLATTSTFGIGNASYRFSEQDDPTPKQVDTVPYGCYRRDVFDRIGLFEEGLVRNQDDEFNGRLIKNGGKIYLLPDLKITYFARSSARMMARMFYEYGLFKPLVNKKLGSPATLRQFFPLGLVLFTLLCVPIYFYFPSLLWLCSALWILYGGAAFISAWSVTNSERSLFFRVLFLFPMIHFSYGWGYLKGLVWTYLSPGVYKKISKPNR